MSQIVLVGPLCPEIPTALQGRTVWIYCPWGQRNVARNLGLKTATEDYVLSCDDDVEAPTKLALERALETLQADPNIGAVAGRYLDPLQANAWVRAYNFHCNAWLGLQTQRFLAGLVLYRKTDFNWPENLAHGGEESVLAEQLQARGRRIVREKFFAAVHDSRHDRASLQSRFAGHETFRSAPATIRRQPPLSVAFLKAAFSILFQFARLPADAKIAALHLQRDKLKIRRQMIARDPQVFQNSAYSGKTFRN